MSPAPAATFPARPRPSRAAILAGRVTETLGELLANPSSCIGLLIITVLVLVAAFAPWIAPSDPYA
ncbi:MAG: hypothetical protein ABW026_17705, partial [Microvirga sp.]